jgi:hypothetical protein
LLNDALSVRTNQWNAANEVTWNMAADSFRMLGYTSGDAAGLPILNNIVRPDEVLTSAHGGQSATPVIDHALRFTLARGLISGQFTYPASHVAAGSGGIPYGTRFRLKNDAATNALIAQMGPESQVIAHALQQYGLILADIGSSMFVQGAATSVDANNNPIIDPTTGKPITWDMNDLLNGIGQIPTTDFEAVDLTPRVTGLSASSGSAGNTLTITGVNFAGAGGHLSVLFVPPGNNPPYTSNGQVTTLKPGVAAAGSVTILDDQHLQVVVPSGASGTVDVQVLSGQLLDDTYNSDAENATAPIFGYGISVQNSNDLFTFLTGNVAPGVTTQPANQTVTAGQTATFTAAASGTPSPTVQWQLSTNFGAAWTNISGATSTSYSVSNTTASLSGTEYRAVFTNSLGSATTNAVTLTVNAAATAPSITTQPTSQTVNAGQTASFTSAAGGSPVPTVQWQVSTNGGSTWGNIGGATTATYSFTTTASQNGNEYRAVFTNGAGSATTNPATLTVTQVTGNTPESVSATAGTPQSALVKTNFAALNATVTDASGHPVAGVTVTFTAPPGVACGTFAGSGTTSETDITNAGGVATSSAFTANLLAGGPYTVTASVSGLASAANFSLTNLSPLGTSPNAVYVENVYALLLNRVADPGAQAWVGALNRGAAPTSIVRGVASSTEYLTDVVASIYQHYLHRGLDAGAPGWVGLLAGGTSNEQVTIDIVSSPEYFADQGGSNSGFVRGLYLDILNRTPSAAEVQVWVNALNSGLTRGQVAMGFLTSLEYRSDLVASYDVEFLGRPADPGGQAAWAQALAVGMSDQAAVAGIFGSPEGFAKWS